MPPLDPRAVVRLSRALLVSLAILSCSACDHAKDLVEQGKKQAADIQKSIESKPEVAATPSGPGSGNGGPAAASPASSSPSPALPAPPPPPAAADPNQLIEKFLK